MGGLTWLRSILNHALKTEDLLRHLGWMRALARSLVRDPDLAEDTVQEAFLAAVQSPPRRQAALGAWLRTALRRFASRSRIQDAARRRREAAAPRREAFHDPGHNLETLEVERGLIEEVLRLEEPHRSTVVLRFFDGLSIAEIARRQGVDESTARWRLKTALGRLRSALTARRGGTAWQVALTPLLAPRSPSAMDETVAAAFSGEALPAISLVSRTKTYILAGATALKLKSILLAGIVSLVVTGFLIYQSSALFPRERRIAMESAPAAPAPTAREESPPASPPPMAAEPSAPRQEAALETGIPSRAIGGVVTSASTEAPIPGAVVLVRGTENEAVAGASGEYTLEGLPPGELFVVARAEGHAERHARFRLSETDSFRQDFRLDPAVELLVIVSAPDGRAVEGVEVTPAQPSRDYIHDEVYTRRTGPDGTAILQGINRNDLPQVNARKPGYSEVWTRDYRVLADTVRAELRIVLEPRPEIDRVVTGTVTGPGGRPLEGALVQWIHSHGEHRGREVASSRRDGRYTLTFSSDRDHVTLSAWGEGWAPVIREGIRPGTAAEPAIVDFQLEAGHWLEGVVVDEEGKPVEEAAVNAMPTLGALRNVTLHPGNLRSAVTDAEGRFRLADLSGPRVAVQLRGPGEGDWAHNMNEAVEVDREVELVLERWKVIRGRVLDAGTDEAVTAFTVKLAKGVGYYDYKRCDPGESFHAADGRFLLRKLDPDRYTFTVESDGYISVLVEAVPSSPPEGEDQVLIEMTRGTDLEGVVIDREARMPIAGAGVAYGIWKRGDLAWDRGALQSMMNLQESVTGADGAFRVVESEAGTLFVQARGYARTAVRPEERKAFLDGAGRLVIPLDRGAVLRGVLYQAGSPCTTGFFMLSREPSSRPAEAQGIREWVGNLERDDSGAFEAVDLAPGKYTLAHYRETPGKRTAGLGIHRVVEVVAEKETTVDFGKDHGSLVYAGRLVDAAGEGLDEVHVELEPAFEWSYTRFTAYVKRSHGSRFYFEGLLPGSYRARVTGPNGVVIPLRDLELRASAEDETLVAGKSAKG